jgi:hypothetical protein
MLIFFEPIFLRPDALEQALRFFGISPKIGVLGMNFILSELGLAGIYVKDTPVKQPNVAEAV